MSLTETLPGTRCQSKCFDQKEVVCNKLGRLIANNFCCAIHHCSALINDYSLIFSHQKIPLRDGWGAAWEQ